MPLCVLEAVGILPDSAGSYEAADPKMMAEACRLMAACKVAGNGESIVKFASRGGPKGAKNPRKTFGAELADPYAAPDEDILPAVDAALRIVCAALLDGNDSPHSYDDILKSAVSDKEKLGVRNSFCYLRDRIGVPRDLPLASARYLRAYLNWGIDVLSD